MSAYYNEVDPHAAQWLRNLIAAGHIAPGEVDERSIIDVQADDLKGFTQCHFFAGIGVWSYALRRAGWPDDRPVWTGSCPCQPFSGAGKGLGHEDERHLWPTWFGLILESRPYVFFGEQVANGDGYAWLDLVGSDVEGIGYALGAVCPAACGVGAPHIRQRLYFVAVANADGCGARTASRLQHEEHHTESCGHSVGVALGDTEHAGLEGHSRDGDHGNESGRVGTVPVGSASEAGFSGVVADSQRGRCGQEGVSRGLSREISCAGSDFSLPIEEPDTNSKLGDTKGRGLGIGRNASQPAGGGYPDGSDSGGSLGNTERIGGREVITEWGSKGRAPAGRPDAGGAVNGFWSGADWVWCRDPSGPRWRPVESGAFPLVAIAPGGVGSLQPGVAKLARSNRVSRLRGYGNAIVAEVAVEFIRAYITERGL